MNNYLSVIIPAYNEEKFIGRLLESLTKAEKHLYERTGEKIEIIVVDNNSTDKTASLAKSYNAVVVHEAIHNISKVRNTGFNHSTGDVVIFLDADNYVTENSLTEIYNSMKKEKYIGGGMKFDWDKNKLFYKTISFGATFFSKIIGLTGVMIYTYREVFEELGGFNEHFYCGEDLLFVRSLKKLSKAKHMKYRNIYQAKVTTSARRFNKMTFRDLVHFVIILLRPSLMKLQNNCKVWYSLSKR